MRVIYLNAWGGAVLDELAAWLPGTGVDVLCVQEVTRTHDLSGWTEFADADRTLPQRANLLADLQELLPDHQARFLVSDGGPVSDAEGNRHLQDFGIATFIHPRFPVIGEAARFVHGTFSDHDVWPEGDRPRIAHAVRLHDRARARSITIAQCHGLRDPAGKHDTPERILQAKRLRALVDDVRAADDLTLVGGDFNVLPTSATFDTLGLVNLVGEADTRSSLYPKSIRHANYALISDPTAIKNFDILTSPEVSDHRPLVIDL